MLGITPLSSTPLSSLGGTVYTLSLEEGVYSQVGEELSFAYISETLSLEEGVYSQVGETVGLYKVYHLVVEEGVYSQTGNALGFSRNLSLSAGVYSQVGNSVGLYKVYHLEIEAGEYLQRGNEIQAAAEEAETFWLNLIVDLLPTQTSPLYQRFGEKFYSDGTEIKLRSWQYEETDQNLVGKFTGELADVSQRGLILQNSALVFQIAQLAAGEVWADTNPTTLLNTGTLGRKDYTISRQGIGPLDTFTFIGLNETDSRLNSTFDNNTVYYDPNYHTVTADDFEGIYDEEGNYTPPDVISMPYMTLYGLLDAVLIGVCGFTQVEPQVPDFPLSLVEFQAGKSVIEVFNGLIGMFEADYNLQGDTLWVRSGIDGTPPDFPAPIRVTVRESSALGVASEYSNVESLMLSVAQEKFIYDYYDDRVVTPDPTIIGELGIFPDWFIEITTTTTYRDYFRNSRPNRPVKTEIRRIVKTERLRGTTIIHRTTEDFTLDGFGRVTYRHKDTEARIPDPDNSFVITLMTIEEEDEVTRYRIHPYEPRTYYKAYTETNRAGLVFIDGDNQQLGEDYYRSVLEAYRQGNVHDAMSADWLKIYTFTETLTPKRNKKVEIHTYEVDYLAEMPVTDITEERDGEVGVNIFVVEQQKIRIPPDATGQTEDVNMGELPLDLALSTGYKILENRQSLPNRVSLTVIGLRPELTKGTPINAIGRSGEDLGNYIIEARTLVCNAKSNDGTGKQYFTLLQCRQSE